MVLPHKYDISEDELGGINDPDLLPVCILFSQMYT